METFRPLRASAVPLGATTSPAALTLLRAGDEPDGAGRADESRRALLTAVVVPLVLVVAAGGLMLTHSLVLTALALVGALSFVVVATMPVRVSLLLVALVPITSGLKRGFPVPGLRMSELLIVAGAATVLALPIQRRPRWSGLEWAVLTFIAAGVVLPLFDLVVLQRVTPSVANLQVLAGPVQFFLLYRVCADALRSPSAQRVATRVLLLSSLPVALLAVAENYGPEAIHTWLVSITGSTAYTTNGYTAVMRASSVFPMWLALAGYLLVPLVLAMSLFLAGDRSVLPTWALVAVLLVDVLAMIASLTATTVMALVAAALYLGWRHGKLVQIGSLLTMGAGAGWALFGQVILERVSAQTVSATTETVGPSWLPQTIGYRLAIWQEQYLPALRQYAATGYGPDTPPGVAWEHTESGYLTLLLRGGLPYLFAAAALITVVVIRSRRESKAGEDTFRVALCDTAAVLALLQVPINLVFPYLTNSGMPQAMWVVWGMVAASDLPGKVTVRIRRNIAVE